MKTIPDIFKQCSTCGHQWKSRDAFLSDDGVEIKGYQVFFEDLTKGLFLFNHDCGTTIAIEANLLIDLYDGPVYLDRKPVDGRPCPGRCLNKNIKSPCSDECKCAFISKIMDTIRDWGNR